VRVLGGAQAERAHALNALKFGEICSEAGLPDGVLNIVTGYGETAGEALSLHEDVDKISFTGSVATARKLLANSSCSNLKRLSLELGGKSPNIVFPDADIDAAVKAALWGVFGNKGEMCTAASRLLLHEDIHDQFLDELCCAPASCASGTRWNPGPRWARRSPAGRWIASWTTSNSETGGRAAADRGRARHRRRKGQRIFHQPTIFSEVAPHMRIAQEEIFGPVLCAMRFRDAVDAIRIANGTIYGLASAVWTRDIKLAHRIAGELKAGSVWINTYNAFDSGSPFGGYKQSGFGRDLGAYALEQYTSGEVGVGGVVVEACLAARTALALFVVHIHRQRREHALARGWIGCIPTLDHAPQNPVETLGGRGVRHDQSSALRKQTAGARGARGRRRGSPTGPAGPHGRCTVPDAAPTERLNRFCGA